MGSGKIGYAGVAGAVGGIVALLGIYVGWWETPTVTYAGTADVSGAAIVANGLYLSMLGGAVGIAAGVLALREVTRPESEMDEPGS